MVEEGLFLGGGEEGVAEGGFGDGDELRGSKAHFCEGESVFGEERSSEHGWVVGGKSDRYAAGDELRERMSSEARLGGREEFCKGTGAEIAGGADFEGDLARDEEIHQAFVVNGGDAMADALGAENFDRVADILRTAHFAGVDDAMETFVGGVVENFAEVGGGERFFVAAESEGDDPCGFHLRGEARNFHSFFGAELAYGVEDPIDA